MFLLTGIGMLRKQRWAHSLALAYFALALVNSIALLVPVGMTRMRTAMDQVQAGNGFSPGMTEPFLLFGLICGFLFTGVMLWFLITRRDAFGAGQAFSQPPFA